MRPSLAVVLITRDAAHLLPRTLEAVSFVDSIVVVDSGSTDGTRDVAQELGARVVLQPHWKGFGHQKSLALSLAEEDWILVLDADEVVDKELASEIRRVTATRGDVSGYSMRRVNFFGDERVRYGHSRPSYVDRLFQRGRGRISENRVHERVLIEGNVERLKGELHHFTTESIAHRIRKNDEYAAVAAEDWFRDGRRASLLQLLLVGPLSLFRDLFLKGGILEGKRGIVLATLGAFYSFSKHAKLWELERQSVARRKPHE
jgi:glycosyltransferase involved in cell wall biosynthesis